MFVFKAMIKIDIMNSWFPFFFINQLIFGKDEKMRSSGMRVVPPFIFSLLDMFKFQSE